jgi:carboxymethylenebutenolidase
MHADLKSLMPKAHVTRREFVVTALASGFALSTQPVNAQTITTSGDGLTAGEIKIPANGGDMVGYRAMPATGDKFPVVLVVQEIFGVHEHIKDVCRRLAKQGYMAIAPELYARQGDVSKIKDMNEIISSVVSKVPDQQVMEDLDATVAFAKASGKANADRLAITGFCWGGRITWLYAAHNPNVKTGAAWYGRLVGAASELQPKHPIDIAAALKAPVLGLYGAADGGIPNDTVEKMRNELKAGASQSDINLYPDTPHGFHADYRPSYRKEQADDAWKKMLAWFKKNGV